MRANDGHRVIYTPTHEHDLDNFIRGIDDHPHRRRDLQEWDEPFPGVSRDPHRPRALLAPGRTFEHVQLLHGDSSVSAV
jgi:hypothetical protein